MAERDALATPDGGAGTGGGARDGEQRPLTVLVVDDNPLIRYGLIGVLANLPGIDVAGEAGDGAEAVRLTVTLRPDVVLLDVRMPGTDGIAAARRVATMAAVLMLTYADEPDVVADCIRAGASGYLVHGRFHPADLAHAIHEVASGRNVLSPAATPALFTALRAEGGVAGPLLTERQEDVMRLLAQGLTNQAIASALFLSTKTVKNHLNHIYAALGVTSRAEALVRWRELASGER